MDFSLTDEQQSFRKLFRDFAQKEVAKIAKHTDESEEPPIEVLNKAAAQGFLASAIPEDLGGAALDPLSYTLLIEETAKACMSTAMTLAVHNGLVVHPIVTRGTVDQKDRWLPILAESLGAYASTEPEAGSDVSRIVTHAKRGDDSYIISGAKTWVVNAMNAKAMLVTVQTDGGPAMLIVDPKAAGIKVGHREPTTGLRGVTFNTVYFDLVEVSATDRIGDEGDGFTIEQAAFTHLRLAVAAGALGLAQHAVTLGRAFAIERKQFGVAIATKQAIGNYFADCDTDLEALRHLIEYAAWLSAHGKEATHAAIKAKMFGAKVAREAANRMLQVHGGYGFSDEYEISQLYRDARALDFIGGTPQLGRVSIAQQVFADSGLTIKP